jgi:tetratricopeptide (TPR) repeat protein
MRTRRWVLPALILIALIIAAAALPAVLRAMPSRYVARLPEPIQALGQRDQPVVLPTAVTARDAGYLLAEIDTPAVLHAPTHAAPPTPTPLPTTAHGSDAASTPVTPTATTAASSPTPAPTTTPAIPIPPSSRLPGRITHQFQDWNNCGPATLTMALTHFQVFHRQSQVASFLKPDKEDRNVTPAEMAAYVNEETDLAALDRVNGNLDILRRLIAAGFPVIVEIGNDPPGDYRWMGWLGHYLLTVAYDDDSRTFWVYDSWFGTSEVPQENAHDRGREWDYDTFDSYWRQFNSSYIVLFPTEEASTVAEIIGSHMDDGTMWQDALRRTQTELQASGDDPFAWFNLGTIYNHFGDYNRAADAFDYARTLGLPRRMLYYQFGPYEAYYETGRYEDVILLADVVLEYPYFEEAYYYKGLALAALGNVRDARDNLEKAAAFNPNFAPAQLALESLE